MKTINISGSVKNVTITDTARTDNYYGDTHVTNHLPKNEEAPSKNEDKQVPKEKLPDHQASETIDPHQGTHGGQQYDEPSLNRPIYTGKTASADMISQMSEVLKEHPDFMYDMENGFVHIINNINFNVKNLETRNGSIPDEQSLKNFFQYQAGWLDINIERDRTKEEIKATIESLSSRDYSNYQAFVFIILSHGREDGILGVDGEVLNVEKDILSPFSATVYRTLADKPKIFIMQACRGDITDEGICILKTDAVCTKAPVYSYIPRFSEYLVLYPSSPGFTSARHEGKGTYYIQSLVSVFEQFHKYEHLTEMLLRVNFKMSQMEGTHLNANGESSPMKSMPCMDVRLKRKYYFHKGILNHYKELDNRRLTNSNVRR